MWGIKATSDLKEGFQNVYYAFVVGSKPRIKGIERGDNLKDNANIFKEQEIAIIKYACTNCLPVVVGNPVYTNALVASSNGTDVDQKNFSEFTK